MSPSLRRLTPLVLAAAVTVAVPAAAQTQKLGIIDTEKVLLESEAGKKVLADLRTLQEAKQREGDNLQTEVADLQKRLTEGRLALAEDKQAELNAQLEEKTIALRRFQDDANRELNKKKDELLAAVDRRVMPIINQVGRELGYTMIFRKFESGLIYAAEDSDITGEVIKRLDSTPAPAGG